MENQLIVVGIVQFSYWSISFVSIVNTFVYKMLTVAGETRVACVIFGVQSDSDAVDAVGVFCWLCI